MLTVATLEFTETRTEAGGQRFFAFRLHDRAPWAFLLMVLYLYDPSAWHLAVSVFLGSLASTIP